MNFLRDLRSVLNLTVVVAGLGYFVDLFDIALFGVVRTASLKDLGLTNPGDILNSGIFIYNCQMVGMMVGGLGWGVLADKRGRLSVMFGSILLYSFANIANAFVWDVQSYALCRFLGGLGLAGELGAAITLVAESLPKEKRGLGTAVVAMLGMLGIVTAAIAGQALHWKTAYLLGGVMGLVLLFARFKVAESTLYAKRRDPSLVKPSLLLRGGRFSKYICCILVGVPNFFTTGVLFTFSPELAAGLNVQGPVIAGIVILFGSIGLAVGDLLAGTLSQVMKSRKRAVGLHLCVALALMLVYFFAPGLSNKLFYGLCFLLGVSVGYWAVLITVAAEQFGTNIRGTVATTVPNFVRGSAALATSGFAYLKGQMSVPHAGLTVGVVCFALALLSLLRLDETFHRDLDYDEGSKDA
ncbi:MAG TPA: MFS transporter [Myxococcaceae bacterium]|jgi:MFS family permease